MAGRPGRGSSVVLPNTTLNGAVAALVLEAADAEDEDMDADDASVPVTVLICASKHEFACQHADKLLSVQQHGDFVYTTVEVDLVDYPGWHFNTSRWSLDRSHCIMSYIGGLLGDAELSEGSGDSEDDEDAEDDGDRDGDEDEDEDDSMDNGEEINVSECKPISKKVSIHAS
jgi:hypothetical protein